MVSPDDVINIYKRLSADNIQIWLTGGWGIDALLGEHTRPHKDLDVIMLVDDVVRLRDVLGREGYTLKELWSENKFVSDAQGTQTETAFVLKDANGRELDAHAMRLDERGYGYPAWKKRPGFIYAPPDLAGMGMVARYPVRCVSAENQMICHTGYLLPDYQWRDLEQLKEKSGIAIPADISGQRAENSS